MGIVIYPKNNGGGGVSEHNQLEGIQGGGADENYHLTSAEHDGVQALLYKNSVSAISVAPAVGERGVSVPLTVTYNILTNDDQFSAASINNGIGSVMANLNTGNRNVSGGSRLNSLAFTLSMNFTRKGIPTAENKSANYNAVIPQWAGVSYYEDFDNYADVASELQKYIQASASISRNFSPVGEYVWFISNKDNAIVQDGNNFSQTVGEWEDGVSEFYKKSIWITLFDDSTEAEVFLYRSRNVKNLANFNYKIS